MRKLANAVLTIPWRYRTVAGTLEVMEVVGGVWHDGRHVVCYMRRKSSGRCAVVKRCSMSSPPRWEPVRVDP